MKNINFNLFSKINIGFYISISYYSMFYLILSKGYFGDFKNIGFYASLDNIILVINLIIIQTAILLPLYFYKSGQENKDNILPIVTSLTIVGVVIGFVGVLFFSYGIAGKYSVLPFGFIFKLIPYDFLIYVLILAFFKRSGSFPWIIIIFYISLKLVSGWTASVFYIFLFCAGLKGRLLFRPAFLMSSVMFVLLLPLIFSAKLYFRNDIYSLNIFTSMSLFEMYSYVIVNYIERLAYFQNNIFSIENVDILISKSSMGLDNVWYVKEFFGSFLPKGLFGLKVYTLENYLPTVMNKELDYGVSYIVGLFGKITYLYHLSIMSFLFFLAFVFYILVCISYMLRVSLGCDGKIIFVFFMTPFLITGHLGDLGGFFYGVLVLFIILKFKKVNCFG